MAKTLPILLAVPLFFAAWQTGPDQAKKAPVPDAKSLAKAADLVSDIFKEEIGKATAPEAQTKLGSYLLQQGDESADDAAARYVLYREARELALRAGDAVLALSAVDKLAKYYQVRVLELKAETISKLVGAVPAKEPSKALAELALALIGEALETDDYEAAGALGKAAADAAKKSQVVSLVTAVTKRNAEIKAARERFSVLQPFVDRLAKDPNDAEANWKMGEYFGLFKGKWERALPLVAKSKNEPFASLAAKDLAGPSDAKGHLELADAWWDAALKQADPQQSRIQERAAYWYDRALPGVAGLTRTKAQKRIDLVMSKVQEGQPIISGPTGFLRTLEGHTGEIRALAISADGRQALSGSVDNTMRLWNLESGKDQVFRGHLKQVWGVAFVPGGRYVLSASWDGTVKMWDANTSKEVYSFSHPIDVNTVTVSKDGKWMLTGCDDKHMRLWDLGKREDVKKYAPHSNFCYACAFSADGMLVASGSADKSAQVFEFNSGRLIRQVEQNNAVYCVAFSPDGKFLFTCGDNAVHMWEIASGKDARRFEAPSGFINSMALTPDGRRLLTGGEDRILRVWDVQAAKTVHHYEGHNLSISSVAISQDGRRAVSGQTDGNIRVWGLPPMR
jgi:hypothetical protein